MDNKADEIKRKIYNARMEARTAGSIHKRDLMKYIHRLQKQLYLISKEETTIGGDTH